MARQNVQAAAGPGEAPQFHAGPRRVSRILLSYRRSPLAMFGTAVVAVAVLVALAAPALAPHEPAQQNLDARLAAPFWLNRGTPYWLGTDALGRDLLSNILYGMRISLLVGVSAIGLTLLLGVSLGILSGFYGGRVDGVIMRAADMQLSIPALLVALAAAAVWGPGLWKLITVIGVIGWAEFARIVRGSVLSVKEHDFVEAARALGARDVRVMGRHVLPNVLTPVVILVSVALPRIIILESILSFLGLGLPLTVPSLGRMISDGYRYLFSGTWWPSIMPGVVLMFIVMGFNLLGDWLRDALDPRLAGR